jgi:hypothetical protein
MSSYPSTVTFTTSLQAPGQTMNHTQMNPYEDGKKTGEWKTYEKSGALKQARIFKLKK